ncbi:MAG: hypothetical protein ACK5P5_05215 [Pseudobdellovibrionaceae bacterium]
MKPSEPNKSSERLFAMASELAEIFRHDTKALPIADYKAAEKKLSIFKNSQFSDHFQNLAELKQKIYEDCLLNISEGGEKFKSGVFYISFKNGVLHSGHRAFSEPQTGELVFSIGLKEYQGLQGYKSKSLRDLRQDDINCLSIYFIYSMAC